MRPILLAAALACPLLGGCASTGSAGAGGWRQIEMRDYGAALTSFERGLESSPSAELHGGRAQALFFLGRLEEAKSSFLAALELEPQEARWHLGLGLVHLAQDDVPAATAACDAALELDPGLAKAYYNRGYARLQVQDYERALADFTQAIGLDANHAAAYNGRGIARARTGLLDEAIEDFQRATSIAPLASAHGNCAAAYYAKGRAQSALTELNVAIRLERANPVYYTNRGLIYRDLGRADLAAVDFEQALALAPGADEIRQLLAAALDSSDSAPSQAVRSAGYED